MGNAGKRAGAIANTRRGGTVTTVEFLTYLGSLDIQVIAEGDRLRCSAPEGVLTPELRSQLAEHKAALLAFLQHRQPSNPPSPSLQPVARDRYSPLSFAQQRLWFLHQLAPDNPFYNVPAAIRLNGQLNQGALAQAFNQIVHRHEALRTTFVKVNGQTMQAITPHVRLPLPVVDLQALPTQEREAIAQQMATQEARHPFDLTTGPVLRVKLLQLAPTDFVLLLTLHHIVADGWSLGVLVRELSTFYTSLSQGQPAGLPELPIQYADFAHWQRQWLQGDVLESQLAYWREQLQNIPRLNLPSDRPRSSVQTYRGATQLIQLPPALTTALEGLSQQEDVSLFMTLLAAFQTLLYRYTGQIDIAVGVPIANRSWRELEGLIGFFVNSLVLRTDLSGNPTFRELLGRVREVALGAYGHQDLPFEKLVEELDPERDLSHNPLFQVGFALQNAPMEPLELPGLSLQPMPFDPGTTRFDLEFHIWERSHGLNHLWQGRADGLSGFVTYSTDLFDRATILRMLGHFQTLLEGIVANPQGRVATIPILAPAEQQQLLEWNQTQAAYPQDACWHQLFEAQVARSPEAVAVVFETEQLTYRELNQRANQLAQYLQQLGVGPDVLVGLCVERSLAMAIGILGILKAGGAYVPLDPTYPRDRLQFMLADAQVPILVTQSWLLPQFPTTQANVACLDQQALLDSQSSQACCSQVTSDNLAYAIYTSGSTGQPKGVLIQHRGLCNVAIAQQQVFNLQRQSRIGQFSSLSFDASVFELLMAFSWGGTLYIPPKSARLPGSALVQFLRDNAITHAILPPAVLAVLPAADLPTLQTAISGGEACSREIVNLWAVDRQFFNAYGPTEVTIWATVACLSPGSGQPSIGRPIANTQIYLLDSQLQPVPIGVAGELCIGGDGLARGYLNRPELTAERFIPHPFAAEPGVRLYKTGDLARYRADGSLEFLGRIDDQVKIRGFRIELGEIETMLRQHPAVREAVALAHANSAGDQRLIAYFTLNHQAEAQELWEQLQQQQVEQWQTLYNQTYHQASVGDPTFNINGWNSSYTGQPIPIEQMREWVSDRVQQILAWHPKRILEIGCGTGLLLFQIAPQCTQYWGTDFSLASLDYIQRQLAARELPQVKLLHRLASDFAGVDPAAFDAVILNSIVQYFPSLDYLLQVLEGAIQAVAPGGFLFIGDVRSLPLLSAFHTAVQLHQAEPTLERSQLQQRVQQAIFEEPELVIDPAFFYALRDRFPSIDRVQIRLQRGCVHNELTQFRYNVLLHIAPPTKASNEELGEVERIHWLNWTEHPLTPATACQRLVEQQPDILGIRGVPNARVSNGVKAAAWLSDSAAPKTVERMREALEQSEQAIDPQAWWNLETELPYKVEIGWSSSSPEGCYDVVFVRQGIEPSTVALPLAPQIERSRPWTTYTNHPLQAQFARQLIPQLRSYLGGRLPEYMVPAAWVPLESLPLTVNGKVDRRALPILDTVNATATRYVAPRSPIEGMLVGIWTDLLQLKRVGVEDNFFELGGHSLLATQMASRIRDVFGIEVPLRSVFETPTIAQLAKVIEHLQINQVQPEAPALVRLDRAAHRRLRSSLTNESSREG